MTVKLTGITWDHPRGHAPLAASIGLVYYLERLRRPQ